MSVDADDIIILLTLLTRNGLLGRNVLPADFLGSGLLHERRFGTLLYWTYKVALLVIALLVLVLISILVLTTTILVLALVSWCHLVAGVLRTVVILLTAVELWTAATVATVGNHR